MPQRVRALILEDSPEDARLLVHELRRAGFDPDWKRVETEADYLAHLGTFPDLILADYNLPQFDAPHALQHLRQRGLDIPFLVVSGSIGEDLAVAAMQQGAADYLLKDRLGRLGQAVRQALDQKRLRWEKQKAEEARRSAEGLFRNLVEHSLVGIHIIQDGRYAYVNPKLAEIFGHTEEEVLALDSWLALVAEEDRELVADHVRRRISTEVPSAHYVFRGLRKDGTVIDVEVHGNRTELNGRPAVIGTLIDVTERRRSEEALRASEERYRSLFENNPHPMWVYDLETFAFLAVNEATIGHYGYSREEFLGMTIMDIRPASEVPALLEHLSGPVPSYGQAGVWRHCKKDGTLIEVEITSHELSFGGRKARLVLAHDITERRRVEAARERLIAILEGTPDLVAISQVDGPVSYLNAAGQRLLGTGPQEGVALSDYRPPWARKIILEEAIPTAIREGVWSGETVLVSKAGEEVPVSQVLIAHMAPSGAVEFLSTIARDIREQKRLEEQLRQAQKMEAVGRLAGGVAHDFNNLLTIIIGYSEVLLSSLRPPDPLRDLIEEIQKAGTRAAALTRQLLAFSRKQVLVPVVLDLNDLLAEMEKMLGRLIGEDVDLAVCPGRLLWRVKADPGQMEQVILNLAVNARDAMPQGGKLTIETANVVLDDTYVTAHAEARTGEYVVLAVSDTGGGMDSATKARIFEPFFTTKGPETGTGLGLATVYGIVKQSGGHIEVYSEPGHGSTFKVYLPRDRGGAPPNKARSPLKGTPRGIETVLLVEDEEAVRSLARQVLESNGYTVLEARHGGEALLTWERYTAPIHLLVTDVVMPHMSGRQLAERLLQLRPGMKVLYLSGYMDDAIVRHGILSANTPFLQKPFTPDTLARKVREVLDW